MNQNILNDIPIDDNSEVNHRHTPSLKGTMNDIRNDNSALPALSITTYSTPYSTTIPKASQSGAVPSPAKDMPFQGVDLTADVGQASTSVSWHDPHPIFVIILVGPDEVPFGIQKDLLCAQSPYYRQEFAKDPQINKVEHIVRFPDTNIGIFGCFQNFIYTGKVYDKDGGKEIPDYTNLMGVWKLATELQMAPLRVAVLNTMAERRQLTSNIPGTSLMIQAWNQTEEGSGLRKMLIGWAAEHMRATPDIRTAFAKALPQEILSELVVVMSDLPAESASITEPVKHRIDNENMETDPEHPRSVKRVRRSITKPNTRVDEPVSADTKPAAKKIARKSDVVRRPGRRPSGPAAPLSPEQDLDFCRGLIERMIRGPGFWTRLVGPFKQPVDSTVDNVPNYFDVVKRPMDLSTIKAKMVKGEYTTAGEFEADVRLIFQNCYEYWTQDDPIWKNCQEFESYFDGQWAERHEYKSPRQRVKPEGAV